MALVHSCSFPMVVELSPASQIGRFTGFYYTASMSAQTITPVAVGFVFRATLLWRALPVYAALLYFASLSVFTLRVKNIRVQKIRNLHGPEAPDEN
jgi:MFS family permease